MKKTFTLFAFGLLILNFTAGCDSRDNTVISGETTMSAEDMAEEEAGGGDRAADDY